MNLRDSAAALLLFGVALIAIAAFASAGVYYYYNYPGYYYSGDIAAVYYGYPYYGYSYYIYPSYYYPIYSSSHVDVGIYASAGFYYYGYWPWYDYSYWYYHAGEQRAQISFPTCSDGTPYGACSAIKPGYCDNGYIVKRASYCGCAEGMIAQGDLCVEGPCNDGTPSDFLGLNASTQFCSAKRPYYCLHRKLIQKSSVCGCPEGYKEDGRDGCVPLKKRCYVYLPSMELRPGEGANVLVYFRDLSHVPTTAVVYCGQADRIAPAACNGSYVNNTWVGSCTAACSYSDVERYPVYYYVSADLDGVLCEQAKVKLIPRLPTTGSILLRAVDERGLQVDNARVSLTGVSQPYYTNERGEVLAVNLNPGSYTATFSKVGYANASASATIAAGQIAVVQATMQRRNCDIGLKLVAQPSCPSKSQLVYQIKLTNYANSSIAYNFYYEGLAFTAENASANMNSGETRIVTLKASLPGSFAGGAFAQVTVNAGGCTTSLQLPVCQSALTLHALEETKNVWPGTKECIKLLVRNYGSDEGTVTMSANDSEGVFSRERFAIALNEAKNLEYCTSLQAGAKQAKIVELKASMPTLAGVLEATRTISFVPLNSSNYIVSLAECAPVDGSGYLAISIKNNVVESDYYAELQGSAEPKAYITQPNIYNFEKGSERTVYVSYDATKAEGGDHIKTLSLQSGGRVVFQKDICLRVEKKSAIAIALSATEVKVEKGSSAKLDFAVKNVGTKREVISLKSKTDAPAAVSISPSSLTLNPGEEAEAAAFIEASSFGITGEYAAAIVAKASDKTVNQTFILKVSEKTAPFAASVEQKSVGFAIENGSLVFKVTFEVNAEEVVEGAAGVKSLPEGWSYSVEPKTAMILKGEARTFVATIVPKSGAVGVYTPSFIISSGERKLSAPFKIDMTQASGLTGFFLAGWGGFATFAAVALAALGVWMYFKSRRVEGELTAAAEPSEAAASIAAAIEGAPAKAGKNYAYRGGKLETFSDDLEAVGSYSDRGSELESISKIIETGSQRTLEKTPENKVRPKVGKKAGKPMGKQVWESPWKG